MEKIIFFVFSVTWHFARNVEYAKEINNNNYLVPRCPSRSSVRKRLHTAEGKTFCFTYVHVLPARLGVVWLSISDCVWASLAPTREGKASEANRAEPVNGTMTGMVS